MEEKKGYKGWANRETWLVKIYIENKEEEKFDWVKRAKEILKDEKESPAWILADVMKDKFEEDIPQLIANLWSYLLVNALGTVDWYAIATSIIKEVKEDG